MNLNSLELWSQSIRGRCRPLTEPAGPLPQAGAADGDDQALLAHLRDEIVSAHSSIEGTRACIVDSWTLMAQCEIELQTRP
jgi:hypothetical protein